VLVTYKKGDKEALSSARKEYKSHLDEAEKRR
jgi:hypothetical protein